MGVTIGGVDFEKVVEAINAQAKALESLMVRVEKLEQEIASHFQVHNAPPV